jgi:hypothetical protein
MPGQIADAKRDDECADKPQDGSKSLPIDPPAQFFQPEKLLGLGTDHCEALLLVGLVVVADEGGEVERGAGTAVGILRRAKVAISVDSPTDDHRAGASGLAITAHLFKPSCGRGLSPALEVLVQALEPVAGRPLR